MERAIYNAGIPSILKSLNTGFGRPRFARVTRFVFCCLIVLEYSFASAADWSSAEKDLAQKIVAVIGPGAVALTVQNRSTLGKRDSDIVQNGLQSALEQVGARLVNSEQAAASISLTLSENQSSYIWVAEARQGTADPAVVMVAVPRSPSTIRPPDSMPMSIRKTLLWSGREPVLDVAVLEENGSPTRLAVLSRDDLSFYRLQAGKWQAEQKLVISHTTAWPLDLRGRLNPNKDHGVDVYLPGVFCQTMTASRLNCHESDDPWPLGSMTNPASTSARPLLAAFFSPRRNFFTGVITPSVGQFNTVPKFYSAAFLPKDKYVLWLFAATDRKVHIIDGIRDQVSVSDWGSDIATLKTSCGAGWQVLATKRDDEPSGDSLRAYELPDRDPVAVSSPIDFPGRVSALWTEASGNSAMAVARNQETGSYEAFRLTLACN
jgi:hypothetical protein